MNKPSFRITHIALVVVAFVTLSCAACAGIVSVGGAADMAAGLDETWTPGTSWFMLAVSGFFALMTFALIAVIAIDLRQQEGWPARKKKDNPPADDRPWERDKGPED